MARRLNQVRQTIRATPSRAVQVVRNVKERVTPVVRRAETKVTQVAKTVVKQITKPPIKVTPKPIFKNTALSTISRPASTQSVSTEKLINLENQVEREVILSPSQSQLILPQEELVQLQELLEVPEVTELSEGKSLVEEEDLSLLTQEKEFSQFQLPEEVDFEGEEEVLV